MRTRFHFGMIFPFLEYLGAPWGRLGRSTIQKAPKSPKSLKNPCVFTIFHPFKSWLGALLGPLGALWGRLGIVFTSLFPLTSKLRRPEGPKRRKTGQPGAQLVRQHRSTFLNLGLGVPQRHPKSQKICEWSATNKRNFSNFRGYKTCQNYYGTKLYVNDPQTFVQFNILQQITFRRVDHL